MIQVPPVLVEHLTNQIVERARSSRAITPEERQTVRGQVEIVLTALAENHLVPVWARVSTTGLPGSDWEATTKSNHVRGPGCDGALSVLWEAEAGRLMINGTPIGYQPLERMTR